MLGKVINSVKVTGDNLCVGTEGSGAFLLDVKTEQLKEQFSSFYRGVIIFPITRFQLICVTSMA